ncbi:heterogeneous nuclear ribonucleoprotein U-like protein 2 isoform X2 [Drosophila willistoni]|uniref:heterogeneous nuclear ribonucleoprotein U-like protein 2 isoform X2 n=1 Tax=Drosophila willistoni TaxID=7260 RepID=UPI000C26D2EC|nr:heterogeneous nuclear ribonucleoprotein U-like protein 2 isoform X2 [Drosophila willistoni]
MDVAKLEKMKVVDLRNELQARGLDTKGVKAVLIERLRAHVDGATGTTGEDGAPGTPSRRQRRTRSMSRSPSPVAVAPVAAEPELETLAEEEQTGQDTEPEKQPIAEVESEAAADSEDEEEEETHPEAMETESHDDEIEQNPQPEAPVEATEEEAKSDQDDEEAEDDEEADQEQQDKCTKVADQDDEVEKNEENQANGDGQKMDVDDEGNAIDAKHSDTEDKEKEGEQEEKEKERRKRSHSRSRSRSSSRSAKRRSGGDSKREVKPPAEERTVPEDEPTIDENKVGLSWFDSDLHLRIDSTSFASAKPLNSEIYSLIWSGARANYGVRQGKVCFEVRLSEESVPENSHHFRDESHVRGFRVGFSKPQSTLLLGEAEHSFGYCESGRKANQSEFTDYGKPYQLDDVIGCYLDLESEPCTIKYTLNGEDLGVAFEFEKSILGEEDALYPHILTKGYEYAVNFENAEELLVNAERPTRKRRRQRKEEDKEEDDGGEKWKVLDEATADDDEVVEKKEDDGKTEEETADKKDEEDAGDKAEKKEEEAESKEEKEDTESAVEEKDDKVAEASVESEDNAEAEAVANGNGESAKETSAEEKSLEENDKPKDEDEDDDGPSPNKRPKTDSDEKSVQSKSEKPAEDHSAEDEYEDVVPVPRETVALLPDYVLIGLVAVEERILGPQRAESRKECEVILLVGLPGSGKTHWTQNHVSENPAKRYEVIGPDSIIAKMTIDGASRKTVHKGRWDKVYEICLNSLGGLEDIAMKRRRNFILDQPTSPYRLWSLAGLMT